MIITCNNIKGSSPAGRIKGYDFARALAVMCMMIVNFESVIAEYKDGFGWLAITVNNLEGRAVPVFVVLAGIGLSMMARGFALNTSGKGKSDISSLLLKRGIFLLIAGMFLRLTWRADILHYYGIYLFFGIFLLRLSNKALWISIAAVISVSIFYMVMLGGYEDLDWNELTGPVMNSPLGMLRHIFFVGYYPVFPWLSLFIMGIWLGRMDMSKPYVKNAMIATGIIMFFTAETLSASLENNIIDYVYEKEKYSLLFLASIETFPATPLYLLSSAGLSFFIIAVSLILTEKFPANPVIKNYIELGRLSLTLYVAHIIIGINGLKQAGYGSPQTLPFAVILSLIFFCLSLIFSHWWNKHFARGPLEWVMRSVSKPVVRHGIPTLPSVP